MRIRNKLVLFFMTVVLCFSSFSVVSARGHHSSGGDVYVHDYYRKDGTHVRAHYRSAPDGNPCNNWSTEGNINPYTGQLGTHYVPSCGGGYDISTPVDNGSLQSATDSSTPSPISQQLPTTVTPSVDIAPATQLPQVQQPVTLPAPQTDQNPWLNAKKKIRAIFNLNSTAYSINGENKIADVSPYVNVSNRTMVPIRTFAEALGATVGWDGSTQTISILKNGKAISLRLGSNIMNVDGNSVNLDASPEISNGHTFLPFRPIGEALGANVQWDNATQSLQVALEQ
jgi:hypothetical protein